MNQSEGSRGLPEAGKDNLFKYGQVSMSKIGGGGGEEGSMYKYSLKYRKKEALKENIHSLPLSRKKSADLQLPVRWTGE